MKEELDIWKDVKYRMKEEGFDYCFNSYSQWTEIEDEQFHHLVDQYLDISKKIKELVDSRIENLSKLI
ncbi:hypothetical protein M0Q97_05690 [Candidatus Dojkabacteria bacterium]|jgi:hypothetical protein|nr:hypothetical protein [Candidatus Dojkabacteria bacterium]